MPSPSPLVGVCVLLLDAAGNPLIVNRKSGQGVCLPGGKVDEGETIQETGVRELQEETGLEVSEKDLQLIYADWCTSETGPDYWTHTFQAKDWAGGLGGPEPQLKARWGTWSELLENSPFCDYNRSVHGVVTGRTHPGTDL